MMNPLSCNILDENFIQARKESATIPTSTFPFLSLPQELRDRVYDSHLSATYNHCLPDSSKLWVFPFIRKTPHFQGLQERHFGGLAILLVSKSVHEEAKLILYKCGTFFFNVPQAIAALRHSLLSTADLQNIIIDLDFDIIFSSLHSQDATDLVKHFAQQNSTLTRRSCEVQFRFVSETDFLLGEMGEVKALKDAIGELKGFRTALVKVARSRWKLRKMMEHVLPFDEELGTYWEGPLGK